MATYTNISGAKLVVNDEFGLPVSFEPGETKRNLSNYLERYTSAVQTGIDILLQRVGGLDQDVLDGVDVPTAVIEEENMAVRPSQPNRATDGVRWGEPGKNPSAAVAGYPGVAADGTPGTANNATRLRRVAFNTEQDAERRQIDTRYLSIKPNLDLAVADEHEDAAVSIAAGTADIDLDTAATVIKINGRRATYADTQNPVYGSLLTEGTYYTAFGTISCLDNGSGTDLIGFRLIGINDEAFTAFTNVAWTSPSLTVTDADTIQMAATGCAAGDTVTATVLFAQDIYNGATADAAYDSTDEIRGWFEVSANATTGVAAGMLVCTENGILHLLDAAAIAYTAWS